MYRGCGPRDAGPGADRAGSRVRPHPEAAPIIGAASSTYLRPGEWQLDVSYRDSTADRHYSLDVYQEQRQTLGTYVLNTQKQTLFNVSHAVTQRFSFSVAVPIPRPG